MDKNKLFVYDGYIVLRGLIQEATGDVMYQPLPLRAFNVG